MDHLVGSETCVCGNLAGDAPAASAFDGDKSWMIECDVCHVWFHGGCVDLSQTAAGTIDKYHCPRCEPLCGPSLVRASTNAHRHDQTDPLASSKATQVGTQVFIEELKRRHFASARQVVRYLKGTELTAEYLRDNGFKMPVLVRNSEGLDIQTPKLSLVEIMNLVGPDRKVDVINVHSQETMEVTLGEFVRSFQTSDQRVLNCLSLEVSDTLLGRSVHAPKVIRDLCWVRNMWPNNKDYNQEESPKVSKYCIMSMAKSYTDFHVDFGGTSVWYHIVSGGKIFYLVSPTTKNLALFERWNRLSRQSETFFADMVGECYKLQVYEGETVLLPSGWIHAVYTPEDSIVLGGNFLHWLDIPMQLRIYDMEKKMRIPVKFKFPHYESVNWYASQHILEYLRTFLNSNTNNRCPDSILSGAKYLAETLKEWKEPPPPLTVKPLAILRDLNKVIRRLQGRQVPEVLKIKVAEVAEISKHLKLTLPKNLSNTNMNLTDRESVRQLMLNRKKQSLARLDDELGNTLLSFNDDKEESSLQVDIPIPKVKVKKAVPLKPNYFIPEMNEVYQDDDYIYPSLDYSDDEMDDVRLESKKDKDTNWNPKARVKPVGEKRERIPRDKARKIEVEKGLLSASRRVRSKKIRKKKRKLLHKMVVPVAVGQEHVMERQAVAAATVPAAAPTRPKKGLATAKQRLGKKLKLKFC